MLSTVHLCLFVEQRGFDGRVPLIERIHRMLYKHFVDVVEKVPDAVVVAIVVHHHEARLAGGHKGRHEPLIEFVNRFQVHIVGFPFVLVDQIEGRMRNKLIKMAMIFFLDGEIWRRVWGVFRRIRRSLAELVALTFISLLLLTNSISKMGLSLLPTMAK